MKTTCIFFFSLLFFMSCSASGSKSDNKSSKSDSEQVPVKEQPQTLPEEVTAEADTVHKIPYYTADIVDYKEYLLKNNKFKDWDKDKKVVILQGVAEKNGTITDLEILRSSGIKELDEEAFRLGTEAKAIPAMDGDRKIIRALVAFAVEFPARR